MKATELPTGWDEQSIQELAEYYDHQTDEEAAAEHEAALSDPATTLMEVPVDLVPLFRELIAKRRLERRARR
jgi:hypothetical protein